MPAVRKATGVHEHTVQQAQAHADAHKQARAKATRRKPTSRVQARRVAHPLAWDTAMRLAGGDVRRLRVVDYMTVMVDG